jgi:hypothetical protein
MKVDWDDPWQGKQEQLRSVAFFNFQKFVCTNGVRVSG